MISVHTLGWQIAILSLTVLFLSDLSVHPSSHFVVMTLLFRKNKTVFHHAQAWWRASILMVFSLLLIFVAALLLASPRPSSAAAATIFFAGGLSILAYAVFLLSYSLTVTEDNLIENQYFRKTRVLKFTDIESITYQSSSDLNGLHTPTSYRRYPKFANARFTNFPRYPVSPQIIEVLKSAKPELAVDSTNDYAKTYASAPSDSRVPYAFTTRGIVYVMIVAVLLLFLFAWLRGFR